MDLQEKDYIQIIKKRDPAYDGRFYFGIKTTKIYCRPTCPAKPLEKNIILFKSPSEAENNGYRACKRCRPDLYPGQKILDQKFQLLSKALMIIDRELEIESIEEIAAKLKISSRHLRRLFQELLGASPNDVINTNRLHMAKRFLLDTNHKIVDIAFAVGFKSLRRFNEAFKELYQESPRNLREGKEKVKAHQDITRIRQMVRAPYDWDYVLTYLDKHLIYGQEEVKEGYFCRYFKDSSGNIQRVDVHFDSKAGALEYHFHGGSLVSIRNIIPKLNQLLDVATLPAHLPKDRKGEIGIRVPTGIQAFEVAVSIIIGQLISTKQARDKLKKLVETFGIKDGVLFEDFSYYAFPGPGVLKEAEIEVIGIPKVKASAIRELSFLIDSGKISFEHFESIEEIKKKLLAIKGIGPWTVEMIAMRCLNDVDAFPASDLIIKRALEGNLIQEAPWKGRRAYLCHYAWKKYAKELSK